MFKKLSAVAALLFLLAASPANAICDKSFLGAGGNQQVDVVSDMCKQLTDNVKSVPVNISTAVTTQLVALAALQRILVTAYAIVPTAAGTFQFVYGTGALCGTGQQPLTGPMALTTIPVNAGGTAAALVVPAGNALCAITGAAVQMSGFVSYLQYQ
jgi:hypothetical protein